MVDSSFASSLKTPYTLTNSSALDSVANLVKNPLAPSTLSQTISIKLDRNNYLLWQTHVLPILKGYKLEGFVNGTKACPPQFIIENNETKLNPAFED